jgi:F0F1-type ATP synthase alpha subunit
MSIKKLFPSKYLKPDNINDGDVVVIEKVVVEKVGMDQEEKPVIYFREHAKGVILNITNAKAIAQVFGDEESTWPGKKLVLISIPSRTPRGEATMSISMKPIASTTRTKKEAVVETAEDVEDAPDLAEPGDPGNWDDEVAA